jgi:hypothetical protein
VSQDARRIGRLVLVPAVITLAVTLLRLVGELLDWSPLFFSKEAGGGNAIVGIAWLVPVFGWWFGWKLATGGAAPGLARALGITLFAIAILPLSGYLAAKAGIPTMSVTTIVIYMAVSVVAIVIGLSAWPALGRTLLAYGFAARIPVALVMLVAILANWGTHYDVLPPGAPEMPNPFVKWFVIGLAPQLTIWMAYTLLVGGLAGILAAAVARRRAVAA